MPTYTVAPAQVAPVIDEMQSAQQRILAMIANLESSSQSHLAEWTAPTQAAYRAAKARWDEAGNEMPVLLGVMRDTLDGIINDYANAERVGTDLFPS